MDLFEVINEAIKKHEEEQKVKEANPKESESDIDELLESTAEFAELTAIIRQIFVDKGFSNEEAFELMCSVLDL